MTLATNFGRLATVDLRDANGQDLADVPVTVRFGLSAAASVAAVAQKHIIRGEFEMMEVIVYVATAFHASAKTVSVGTSASVARFASRAGSAGEGNERVIVAPASADVPNWRSTGTAESVTTVKAYITDVSGVVGTGQVTITYAVRA